MFEPKILKTKEIEKIKCGKWSYYYEENGWTHIFNEAEQKIAAFSVKMEDKEIDFFRVGFEKGFTSGREFGKVEKSEEIKKILKI